MLGAVTGLRGWDGGRRGGAGAALGVSEVSAFWLGDVMNDERVLEGAGGNPHTSWLLRPEPLEGAMRHRLGRCRHDQLYRKRLRGDIRLKRMISPQRWMRCKEQLRGYRVSSAQS